jgi:hypothetical protein
MDSLTLNGDGVLHAEIWKTLGYHFFFFFLKIKGKCWIATRVRVRTSGESRLLMLLMAWSCSCFEHLRFVTIFQSVINDSKCQFSEPNGIRGNLASLFDTARRSQSSQSSILASFLKKKKQPCRRR